jgi:PKD repeat protein
VKLTVTNAAGSDVQRETDYITVTSIPESPKAAFTSNKQTGTAPLTVRFTDQSTGTAPLTYAWDFTNDGTTDSTARNPSFTYTSAGTYTVNLTVTNAVGSDVQRETDYITITDTPAGSHSGIALTFDDNSIDQWYAIRDLLKQYNAHATFFVTQYANLDESQINELKALQADGNEIGYHGYAHLDATEYLTNHTIAEYMNNEIINGVTLMRADGFDPVDFALPGGAGDENSGLIAALQQNFTHIRGIDRAPPFYQYGSNVALVHAQGIDDTSYGQSINDLYDLISTAKEDDEIVIFYAHIPVETVTGEYQVSYDRLNDILKNGSDQNMTFYTISEIH